MRMTIGAEPKRRSRFLLSPPESPHGHWFEVSTGCTGRRETTPEAWFATEVTANQTYGPVTFVA